MSFEQALSIRGATLADSDEVAVLLRQLGYPTPAREVRVRLERLMGAPAARVLVAEVRSEQGLPAVAGLASFQVIPLLERSRPQCRITALVVDAAYRRRGVAGALVGAIEEEARRRGCFRLEVTTNPRRTDALPFYEAVGFSERRYRLVKELG